MPFAVCTTMTPATSSRDDRGAQAGRCQCLAKPAGLQKVPLHVDDEQRDGSWGEGEGVRLGVDLRHACFLSKRPVEAATLVTI